MGTLRKDRLKIVEGGKIRDSRRAMPASPFRLWPTEKGKHACKDQNECKGQGGCKTSDAGCKGKNSSKPARARVIAQPTEPSYLNFSNQAIAARLSEQLGPLCGVGVSTLRPHPKAEVTRSSYWSGECR